MALLQLMVFIEFIIITSSTNKGNSFYFKDEPAPNVYRGDHHDHHGSGGINSLSILVAPLAALALLGAAATVASNPVLLSIAVLNRKRRDVERIDSHVLTPELETKLVEMEVLITR